MYTLGKTTALVNLGLVKQAKLDFNDYYNEAKDTYHDAKYWLQEKLNPTPIWKKALPYAAGAGAAALGYKALRTPHFSSNPVFNKIQKASKGRVTVLVPSEINEKVKFFGQTLPPWLYKRVAQVARGVDDIAYVEKPSVSAKQEVFENALKEHKAKNKSNVSTTKHTGVVLNYADPFYNFPEHTGDVKFDNLVPAVNFSDKAFEGYVLKHYAPGLVPTTHGVIQDFLPKGKKPRSIRQVQRRVLKALGENIVVKPRQAAATSAILRGNEDWSKLPLTDRRRAWIREILKNPNSFVVQEHLPIEPSPRNSFVEKLRGLFDVGEGQRNYLPGAKELPVEMRFHVVNGQIVPGTSAVRYPTKAMSGFSPPKKLEQRIIQELQPQLDKLPNKWKKNVTYGLDVVKLKNGKFKVIETNAGGPSGFLQPDAIKSVNFKHPWNYYKHLTGRAAVPEAALKATALGTSAAGLAALPVMTHHDS